MFTKTTINKYVPKIIPGINSGGFILNDQPAVLTDVLLICPHGHDAIYLIRGDTRFILASEELKTIVELYLNRFEE